MVSKTAWMSETDQSPETYAEACTHSDTKSGGGHSSTKPPATAWTEPEHLLESDSDEALKHRPSDGSSWELMELNEWVVQMYRDTFQSHRDALAKSKAIVAVLISEVEQSSAEAQKASDLGRGIESYRRHRRLHILAEATLRYFGSPRRLLVCSLKDDECNHSGNIQCVQMALLKELVHSAFWNFRPPEGPWIWPLLGVDVPEAILAVQFHEFMGHFAQKPRPCWYRILVSARVCLPRIRPFIRVLHDQIGPSVAYAFAKEAFFSQKLWLLAVWSIVALIIDIDPSRVSETDERRILWEIYKAGIVVWGVWVLVLGRRRNAIHIEDGDDKGVGHVLMAKVLRAEISEEDRNFKGRSRMCKFFKCFCEAFPTILLFMITVTALLLLTTMLIIYIIYNWGDCIKLGCTCPQTKHGFWGWCAEVGVDILVAIIFEIFYALAQQIAEWVSVLRAFETLLDQRLSEAMLSVLLASVERIGTFGVLAFVFTPQWLPPSSMDEAVGGGKFNFNFKFEEDCRDLPFGRHDVWCYARRLPLQSRRLVFQKAFKGPFVVAPFVGILVKVIIPYVAWNLDMCANGIRCCFCRASGCCFRGFCHILALIFAHDGDSLGCCKYVAKGWPFQEVQLVKREMCLPTCQPPTPALSHAELPGTPGTETNGFAAPLQILNGDCHKPQEQKEQEKEQDLEKQKVSNCDDTEESQWTLVNYALRYVSRKKFCPLAELLEIKLSLLWILCFAPVMPLGILPTLVARLIESRTDLAKLLYVRRTVFPEPEHFMHYTESTFLRAAVIGSIGWSLALSLITYNDDLYKNSTAAIIYAVVLFIWMTSAGFLMLMKYEM